MEIRDRKAAQRRAGIMARRGLPQAERAAANAAICARLLALPCFQKAENLLLYAAFGGEVDLAVLAEQAARLGKTVGKGYYDRYLPRCRNAVALGVAFEAQRVPEAAAEEQDWRLDGFVTERKVYRGTDEFEL